jgi:class 3 adenylate cyclase
VTLNDRQDYFGQTVNIASRIQDLADAQAILANGQVVRDPHALSILTGNGIVPLPCQAELFAVRQYLAQRACGPPAGRFPTYP